MLKRCSLLILASILLTGCLHRLTSSPTSLYSHPAEDIPGGRVTRFKQVSEFNQVDIEGRINVSLHSGYKKPQLILRGDARDLPYVKVEVHQGTLFLSVGGGYPHFGEISADISTRYLNKIKYIGAGVVRGMKLNSNYLTVVVDNKGTTQLGGHLGLRQLFVNDGDLVEITGISSPYLELHLRNNPKVKLSGLANLAKLDMDGTGYLSLYWVKSKNLTINARRGSYIQLAGMVNRLDLELWGRSQFKGRYLRVQRVFVKTHGHSVAEIAAVHHQSTLATDASDIHFYNLSTTRADFMGFNGAVLDMRDWNDPYYDDYTKYNHQIP